MVDLRRSGRTPHELIEVPPTMLDCGHRYGPQLVTVGFDWHEPSQRRVRSYRCRACGLVSYSP
jgi:hypothetical protein